MLPSTGLLVAPLPPVESGIPVAFFDGGLPDGLPSGEGDGAEPLFPKSYQI